MLLTSSSLFVFLFCCLYQIFSLLFFAFPHLVPQLVFYRCLQICYIFLFNTYCALKLFFFFFIYFQHIIFISKAASSEDCMVACFQMTMSFSCRHMTPAASFMALARLTCEKRHNVFLIDVLQQWMPDTENHSCRFQLSVRMCTCCNLLCVE